MAHGPVAWRSGSEWGERVGGRAEHAGESDPFRGFTVVSRRTDGGFIRTRALIEDARAVSGRDTRLQVGRNLALPAVAILEELLLVVQQLLVPLRAEFKVGPSTIASTGHASCGRAGGR